MSFVSRQQATQVCWFGTRANKGQIQAASFRISLVCWHELVQDNMEKHTSWGAPMVAGDPAALHGLG